MRGLRIVVAVLATGSLGVVGLNCAASEPGTALLRAVTAEYPGLRGGLLEELGVWTAALGEPQTLAQADGGRTYYYWPHAGLAAFAHPLFEGQYRHRGEGRRIVTSVIIPTRLVVRPHVPPATPDSRATFYRLAELRFDGKLLGEMSSDELLRSLRAARPRGEATYSEIAPPCRLFGRPMVRLYFEDGEVVAVEVRENRWWSHYD